MNLQLLLTQGGGQDAVPRQHKLLICKNHLIHASFDSTDTNNSDDDLAGYMDIYNTHEQEQYSGTTE